MPTSHPVRVASEAHRRTAEEVLGELEVVAATGLSSAEVSARRVVAGPNELVEPPRPSAWRRWIGQFRDLLILILLVAAVVSYVVSGELKTPLVVLAVVILNATIGFVQEARAESALEALREMVVTTCRVRRDGELQVVPAGDLVPGDVVAVEAGDRIPADGRLLEAVNLEVEESALTGESVPAAKSVAPVAGEHVPLGDRSNSVYMQTTVTRGRGELVVTATGMSTEIGRIASLLHAATPDRTPLQRQLDGLARTLAVLAGLIVAVVFAVGLVRGEPFADLFLTAVALAVASIPEGLPAVTAVTLAIGVSRMAHQGAIVKRLSSVETLGSTSVICSDKTGTLTLNQMTVAEVVVQGRSHVVTGEGYDPSGSIERVEGDEPVPFAVALMAMALCNDASLRRDGRGRWRLVGDPTEGALLVAALKGGLDVSGLRSRHPRRAEVPFDSTHKLMATLHEVPGLDGEPVHRLFVKGALDSLAARAVRVIGPDGVPVLLADHVDVLDAHAQRLAERGLRVLAVADRSVTADEADAVTSGGADPMELVSGLTILALAGIVDPPRTEAMHAIAEARAAGITVKMITGDHATTATAIARSLGLGEAGQPIGAVSGAEIERMTDRELAAAVGSTSVFARVAPEHKLRLVAALEASGEVVAMTGDGVNDAPALRQADIGVAMGITGTEVTKEAASMVLTDDNFATIVAAVRQGRTIYANIVKFVRFQLSTTLGFAAVFLAASILGIASGQPFTAIAILWVNVIMDGPPAMALGVDPGAPELMERGPRPRTEPVLTAPRRRAIGFAACVMAAGTLAVLAFAPGPEPRAGTATVAGTMAFNTFVLFQFFNILNVRSDRSSVLRRETFSNRWLWLALAAVLALQVAVTHVGFAQRLFDTAGISAAQWLVCIGVASSVLWLEEARKVAVRRREAGGRRAGGEPLLRSPS